MLVLVMLAGCRFEFAEHHDAAIPMDAPPQGLACNTPVRLGDGMGTELAATASATRVFAVWLEPSGAVHGAGAQLAAQVATAFDVGTEAGTFVHAGVAADATGKTILGVATDPSGASYLRSTDDATLTFGAAFQSTIALTGSHGVAPTGVDAPAWAIGGNDSATAREMVAGVNATGELGPMLDSGNFSARTTLVPFGARIAVIDNVVGNTCDIKTVTPAISAKSTTASWGTAGQCSEPTAVFSPGRADALLVRHDETDNDLNHVIATITMAGALAIPGESRLRSPADEARGVGVGDGYWVAYETAGTLEVVHVDFAGTVGTPIVLGMIPSPTGHDLVLFGGEPYAIWLGDGLELARICS
ncbi:MAG TPA: hypothetical protein VIV58_17420 [Kofleriaceae bacterium]